MIQLHRGIKRNQATRNQIYLKGFLGSRISVGQMGSRFLKVTRRDSHYVQKREFGSTCSAGFVPERRFFAPQSLADTRQL